MYIVKDDSMCQLIGVEDVIGHTSAIDLKLFSINSFVQHCPTTKANCSSTVVSSRYDCNFELVSNPVVTIGTLVSNLALLTEMSRKSSWNQACRFHECVYTGTLQHRRILLIYDADILDALGFSH